jgi:hypothetical protein
MVECQSEDQARQQAELIAAAVRNAVI